MATMAGVRVGHYALYHGLLSEWVLEHILTDVSMHIRFGMILSITVLCVTVSTGLLLGFALMNWKASLRLAASTGLAAVLASLLSIIILVLEEISNDKLLDPGFGVRGDIISCLMKKKLKIAEQ